jgi:hypothetical protein
VLVLPLLAVALPLLALALPLLALAPPLLALAPPLPIVPVPPPLALAPPLPIVLAPALPPVPGSELVLGPAPYAWVSPPRVPAGAEQATPSTSPRIADARVPRARERTISSHLLEANLLRGRAPVSRFHGTVLCRHMAGPPGQSAITGSAAIARRSARSSPTR